MLCLPSQTPNLAATHGLTRAQADEDLWVIELATGHKRAGAEAVQHVLIELGGAWKFLARLAVWRVNRWLYRWMVRHRAFLSRWRSTVPECERPGVVCD